MPDNSEFQSLVKKCASFYSDVKIWEEREPVAELFVEIKPTNWYGEEFHSEDQWGGVALPLIRRTFENLLANDLVSVQPMSAPVGELFYLDYKYGNDDNVQKSDTDRYIMGVDPCQSSTENPQWLSGNLT